MMAVVTWRSDSPFKMVVNRSRLFDSGQRRPRQEQQATTVTLTALLTNSFDEATERTFCACKLLQLKCRRQISQAIERLSQSPWPQARVCNYAFV